MIEKIETKRLILRAPTIEDLNDFYNFAKKLSIGPNAGWIPHDSIEDSKEMLNVFIKSEDVWAITIKPNNIMVGTIGLHIDPTINAKNAVGEIGFALDDCYWNKGYMTEALSAVIDKAFNKYGFKKLMCGHLASNIASQKVIIKNNFKFSHIEKNKYSEINNDDDVYMYELLNPNLGGKQ